MAVFDADSSVTHPLDYQLAVNGFVTLFRNRAVLEETVTWLSQHGYRVVEIDASAWNSDADMHSELAREMDFPDHYGRNLDALSDCLSDVGEGAYGISLDDTGLVLVLLGFDQFFRLDTGTAHALLDIYAWQARIAALVGNRMLCLVQSNDPHLQVAPVGATEVGWNPAEWKNSRRKH